MLVKERGLAKFFLVLLFGLLVPTLIFSGNSHTMAQSLPEEELLLYPEGTVRIAPGDNTPQKLYVSLKSRPTKPVTIKISLEADGNFIGTEGKLVVSQTSITFSDQGDDYQKAKQFTAVVQGKPTEGSYKNILLSGTDGKKNYNDFFAVEIMGSGKKLGKLILDPYPIIEYNKQDAPSQKVSVSLRDDPQGEVKIKVSEAAGKLKLSKSSLTFNSTNFKTAQTFEVSQVENYEGDNKTRIELSGSSSKVVYNDFIQTQLFDFKRPPVENSDTGPAGFGSPLGALISEESGFVYQAWRVTRSVINILLIVALFVISFSNITRINIDTYTIKKALPNLIIGIILANASLYIIRFMSDITTVVTYFFVNQVGSTTFADFVGDTAELFGKNAILTIGWGVGLLAPLLVLILALITIIGLLWLSFLLYFRLVAIYLLTILSPLAFVSYGIPGLDKYFKQWWQQFTKWLFIVPAMSAVFWLMLVIGNAGGNNQSIARLLIMYVLFFTALTLPSKMGGAVIDKASKAFMKYTGAGAAKQGAIETAGRTGQQLALRAPLYGRLKKSMEFAKKAQEQDIKNLQTSAESKAMRGRNYRKFARTTKRGEELSNYLAAEQAKANTKAGEGKLANFLDRLQRRGGSLPERQISSAYNKGLEEAREKIEMNRKRVAFTKNDDNKKLMEQFAAASSKDKAFADAVQSAEREVTGIYTTGRKDVISKLREAGDIAGEIDKIEKKPEAERTDEEKGDLTFWKSYHSELLADLEKLKVGHDDLAGMSAEDMVQKYQTDKTFSTLVKAEEKRQAKAFNEGIKAQNEDTLADGSVKSILKDINEGLKDLNETERANLKKKFFNSDTIGMDAKFQNTLIKNIQALKDIGKNQRDTRSPEALRELASMIMKDGEKPIVVKSRTTGEEHTFDNFDEFQSKLFSGDKDKKLSTQDMKNAVLSHDSISGTPASHLGKTPKKDD